MTYLIIAILIFIIAAMFSKNSCLRFEFESSEKLVETLDSQLKDLQEKHPECSKCHGKGLKIVGRKITECGVIWKQDGTKCDTCNGKGSL